MGIITILRLVGERDGSASRLAERVGGCVSGETADGWTGDRAIHFDI